VILFLALGPCWASQQGLKPEEKVQPSPPLVTPSEDYRIAPGDLLSIRVFQQPELSGDVKVSAQGFIRLLYIDEPIKAVGYSEWELSDVLRKAYTAILRDPQVSVQVREARQAFAYILGQVNTPGPVPWVAGTRLLNLIVAGRGLNERAANVVYILRSSVWSPDSQAAPQDPSVDITLSSVLEAVDVREMLLGKVELNKLIYPGDIVSVPEVNRVFVGGNVNTPGAFDLRGDLTLTQAVTLAGGLKPGSKQKLTIIRRDPGKGGLTELVVDLGEVEKNRVQDPVLQGNDLIVAQSSTLRNIGISLLNALVYQAAVQVPFYVIFRSRF
jgi:polysaccharide export outer membrane protein